MITRVKLIEACKKVAQVENRKTIWLWLLVVMALVAVAAGIVALSNLHK